MSLQGSMTRPTTIKRRRAINFFPYIVIAPMMFWFVVFVLYPVVYSIWTSLHLWIVEDPGRSPFVGLQNYIELFGNDRRFSTAFGNTLGYGVVVTLVTVPLGFVIAALLARVQRFNRLYVFAFFLPSLVPASVVGIIFGFFYQPAFGTANYLLISAGLEPLNFLKDPKLAIWTIATVEMWQRVGFVVLITYAGLITLPPALIEAARIDGANGLRIVFSITLPLMTRVLLFVSVVTLIASLQAFDLIYVMTTAGGSGGSAGGPGISAYTLGLLVYNEGLQRFHFGTASASAAILFVLIFVGTLLQFRFFRSNWEY